MRRAGVIVLALGLLAAACGGSVSEAAVTEPMLEISIGGVVRYGDAPQQFVELRTPDGDGPFPVIVFIHGGFWRNRYDLSLAHEQAADARKHGYATWNIEYRRVGDAGGGYPGTLDDVAAAIDAMTRVDAPLDLERVYVVGHSAGGHLALWVGQRDDAVVTPRLVVGQAPVADLANSLDLGRGAVEAFHGWSARRDPGGLRRRRPGSSAPREGAAAHRAGRQGRHGATPPTSSPTPMQPEPTSSCSPTPATSTSSHRTPRPGSTCSGTSMTFRLR